MNFDRRKLLCVNSIGVVLFACIYVLQRIFTHNTAADFSGLLIIGISLFPLIIIIIECYKIHADSLLYLLEFAIASFIQIKGYTFHEEGLIVWIVMIIGMLAAIVSKFSNKYNYDTAFGIEEASELLAACLMDCCISFVYILCNETSIFTIAVVAVLAVINIISRTYILRSLNLLEENNVKITKKQIYLCDFCDVFFMAIMLLLTPYRNIKYLTNAVNYNGPVVIDLYQFLILFFVLIVYLITNPAIRIAVNLNNDGTDKTKKSGPEKL